MLVVCSMLSAAAAEPRPQARNNDLDYIPIDVELVAGMDLPRLRMQGARPKALTASLNVASSLAVSGRLRMDAPDTAAKLAVIVNAQPDHWLTGGSDGADLKIGMMLPADRVDALAKAITAEIARR